MILQFRSCELLPSNQKISSPFEPAQFVSPWVTVPVLWQLIPSTNARFSYPGVESYMYNSLYGLCILSGCLMYKTHYHILSTGSRDKQTDVTASTWEGRSTKKWRNVVVFWGFFTQDVGGMQRWFFNIHQRPWNHEFHSTMSRRFMDLEVLLCSSFLEASVLGNQERRKCQFCISQTARPFHLFSMYQAALSGNIASY